MLDEPLSSYRNALVIGTGGGNDIVSAVLVSLWLSRLGVRSDVAGMLSPAAVHTFDGKVEDVVNEIKGDVRRYIPAREPVPISFIDRYMPEYAAKMGIPVGRFYDISSRYGTDALVAGVNSLMKKNGYDVIVGVDVGGDILARGPQDSTLLSPLMDFSSLFMLGQVDAPSALIEFGLLTDGELRPDSVREIEAELKLKGILSHESKISKDDPEVKRFSELFSMVKQIRPGHTAVMTLQTLDMAGCGLDLMTKYWYKSIIQDRRWTTTFDVVIPHERFGTVWTIDAKRLARDRSETAITYENPLEQYVRLKQAQPSWKTEYDLGYIWSGDSFRTQSSEGQMMQLLVPSTQIHECQRREMLAYGIERMHPDDLLLLHNTDYQSVKGRISLFEVAGDFLVVAKRPNRGLCDAAGAVVEFQVKKS